ncbi:MAG: hypothetical protein QOG82_2449 [Actinomycetota bacterium]|nr:hypothetical protein [Actinomycetota bacterium]
MLGLAILAVLVGLAVGYGHPWVVRDERRRLEELRPYDGHQVELTAGGRFALTRTGTLGFDQSRRAVHLVVTEGTGVFGLPGPPRTYHYRLGDIHRLIDRETGERIRWR